MKFRSKPKMTLYMNKYQCLSLGNDNAGHPTQEYVTDVYARGVNVNLTPLTSKRGALATDARGCSLWRSLLERLPPVWESWVRDPLGTDTSRDGADPGGGVTLVP